MSNTEGPKPDLVVGIDFGMTGTAVAWALPSADVVNSITTWPGIDGNPTKAPKAPSAISLSGPNGQPAWGFRASAQDISRDSVRSLFKPWLDENFTTLAEALQRSSADDVEASDHDGYDIEHHHSRMEVSEAEECLKQYLLGLYDYIRQSLEGHLPNRRWLTAVIWFRFSYPATWDEKTIKRFEDVVESANFSRGRNHKVSARSLNEAEAAVASFFVEETRPPAGQTILIADLGGCTTDMGTFEIDGDNGNEVSLRQVSDSDALYNGSLHIDGAIRSELYPTIREKIASMETFRRMSAAEKQQHARFEVQRIIREDQNYIDAKHGFESDTKPCKVHLGLKNQRGQPVTRLEIDLAKALRKALDKHCEAVLSQIEDHIDVQPKVDSLDRVVLTGGVSNNKYIRARLEKELEKYHVSEVMVPETPELAVSRGLVHEALESVNRGSVFRYESAFFYGVVISSLTGNSMPIKLVSKGKAINTKESNKTKSIDFPTMNPDIRFVRWTERNGASNNEDVGCLTDGLPDLWAWKKSTFGNDLYTQVKVTFDRRTISVTLEGAGGKKHKRVFNEAWHRGAVPPVRRKRDHPIIRPLLALIGPVAALAGLVVNILQDE